MVVTRSRFTRAIAIAATLLCLRAPHAQAPPQAPAPIVRPVDAELEAASAEIGRALFLRCFCADNNLRFDAQGHLEGAAKTTDWTLSGVNILKAEHRAATSSAPAQIELEGVRVAVRYATDRHEFDRHPQNDDKLRIAIAATGEARQFERALAAVFAEGIDQPLQRSMPEFWRHNFDAQLGWPQDDLSSQVIYSPGASGPANAGLSAPVASHKVEAESTTAAARDKVQGTVVLRAVIDAQGVPRRITVVQPLGYGLDAKAVEAVQKWRFSPGTLAGKPVATNVVLREDFVIVTPPR